MNVWWDTASQEDVRQFFYHLQIYCRTFSLLASTHSILTTLPMSVTSKSTFTSFQNSHTSKNHGFSHSTNTEFLLCPRHQINRWAEEEKLWKQLKMEENRSMYNAQWVPWKSGCDKIYKHQASEGKQQSVLDLNDFRWLWVPGEEHDAEKQTVFWKSLCVLSIFSKHGALKTRLALVRARRVQTYYYHVCLSNLTWKLGYLGYHFSIAFS